MTSHWVERDNNSLGFLYQNFFLREPAPFSATTCHTFFICQVPFSISPPQLFYFNLNVLAVPLVYERVIMCKYQLKRGEKSFYCRIALANYSLIHKQFWCWSSKLNPQHAAKTLQRQSPRENRFVSCNWTIILHGSFVTIQKYAITIKGASG